MNAPIDPSSIDTSHPLTLVVALSIAVVTMAGVVAYLFRYFTKKSDTAEKERLHLLEAIAKEREAWAAERVQMGLAHKENRAEYEAKHREVVERHAASLRELYDDAREQETISRREYAANMEVVAEKARESQEKVGQVLDKIYNRFIAGLRRKD